MTNPNPISIRDTVGAALRFVRENTRFVFAVAGIAALAQGALLVPGPNLVWMVGLIAAVVGAHTALTSAALDIPRPFTNRLPGDSLRVAAAMAMIGVLFAILFIMMTFVAMSVLIAPYESEVKAAGEDQAALRAVMDTAIQNNPNVMPLTLIVGVLIVFALTTRLYLAAPATIERKRITLFESWRMTRGNFLRIAGARLFLLGPAFILAGALQTLVGAVLRAPTSDPVAMLNYGQANPLGLAVFYTISIFLQIVIFSVLEAGLSAKIYRALNPPAA